MIENMNTVNIPDNTKTNLRTLAQKAVELQQKIDEIKILQNQCFNELEEIGVTDEDYGFTNDDVDKAVEIEMLWSKIADSFYGEYHNETNAITGTMEIIIQKIEELPKE